MALQKGTTGACWLDTRIHLYLKDYIMLRVYVILYKRVVLIIFCIWREFVQNRGSVLMVLVWRDLYVYGFEAILYMGSLCRKHDIYAKFLLYDW